MNKDSVLEVRDLSVSFDQRCVLEGVSYTLRRGETLGIVGESGSGKSVGTLALMGLLPPNASTTGTAMLGDTNLLTLSEQEQRTIRGKRIAMIFQEPMTSLNPVQRCGEQVMEMMRAHSNEKCGMRNEELKARTIELFHEVLLPRPEKIFDAYPHEISGGQKQRVMIAMALANDPDILIADEPTTALDVTVQRTILELLRQLQQRHGTSIIFITHDLGVIAQVADRIMVMYRGHVVEEGSAADILRHPREPYTQGLLACRPPLDSHPHRLPTVEDFMEGVSGSEKGEERREQTIPNDDTTAHSQPLISVHDLSVTYTLKRSLFGRPLQTLKGVDGITFDIHEGETLGLVGESGCGKSTLGRALLRLIDHSAGSIAYRGTPLDQLSHHQMRALRPKLQIIFQDPYSSLNPRITIGDAIAFLEKLSALGSGNSLSERNFAQGNVVFQPMNFSEYRAYKSQEMSFKKYSGFEWDCVTMPAGPSGDNYSRLDTLSIAMSENTTQEEMAWEFMKLLTTDPQIQSEIFEYSAGISVLPEVTQSEETRRRITQSTGSEFNLDILESAMEKSVTRTRFRGFDNAQEEVGLAVRSILESNSNIQMEQIIWNRTINNYLKNMQQRE